MNRHEKANKQALISMITQKISEKMDSLAEIPCISQRWIWELIQNAKDADSQFGKIKIKIEIHDHKFVFSHNGSPFSLENLSSLIFHYSAKEAQNKDDVETTGKYGTGFMVTYAVSKKVLLECKYKGVPDLSDDQADEDDDIEDEEFFQQALKPSPISPPRKTLMTNKNKLKESKTQKKTLSELAYYQDIKLLLDRNYENIQELKDKITKVNRSFERQLKKKQKIKNYVRTQQSFDTRFVYGQLDAASFLHIDKGMASLKQIFPLVLLFNKKLHSLTVSNYSTKLPNVRSFQIIRKDHAKIDLFSKFTASVSSFIINCQTKVIKNIKTRSQQYLFSQSSGINGIIAIPVRIVNSKIHLRKFPKTFPKMFKEFPLIGCQDIGFNFAFTSKELYPSENRKQLLLKQIEGRPRDKPIKNWEILNNLLAEVNDFYVLLARKVAKGKFNFFMFPSENSFLYKSSSIKARIEKIERDVSNFQIFQNPKKEKYSIKKFQIIYEPKSLIISSKANQLLKSMFNSLSFDDYEEFSQQVFLKSSKVIHKLNSFACQFVNLEQCIDIFSTFTYASYRKYCASQDIALAHLQKIYLFLMEKNRQLLYDPSKKIILTQQLQFKSFHQGDKTLQLEVDFQYKQQYVQIAQKLEVPYKRQLIHQRFNQIFQNDNEEYMEQQYQQQQQQQQQEVPQQEQQLEQQQENKQQKFEQEAEQQLSIYTQPEFFNKKESFSSIKFQRESMLEKIQEHFISKIKVSKNGKKFFKTQDFIMLGQYLSSFSAIWLSELKLAVQFDYLKTMIKPLCNPIITSIDEILLEKISNLEKLFIKQFKRILLQSYKSSKTISQFTDYLTDQNKKKAFSLINYLHRSLLIRHADFPNADQEIMIERGFSDQLKWLKEGYSYLSQEDIQIYDKLCGKCKQIGLNLKPIKKTLVHPKITNPSPDKNTINFAELFKVIKIYYNQSKISLNEKELILNYTFKIYEEFIINNNQNYRIKFELFKEIINQRHLEFGKLLDTLKDEDKDLICKIFKMKQKFGDLREIITKYQLNEILATMRMVEKSK